MTRHLLLSKLRSFAIYIISGMGNSVDYLYNAGDGCGFGNCADSGEGGGYGDGDYSGNGFGFGDGDGYGYGYGSGCGDGYGECYGDGVGSGGFRNESMTLEYSND